MAGKTVIDRITAILLVLLIGGCSSGFGTRYTRPQLLLPTGGSSISAIRISPDGKTMITVHPGMPSRDGIGQYAQPPALRLWSLTPPNATFVRTIDITKSSLSSPEFDSSGQYFFFADRKGLQKADLEKMFKEDRNACVHLDIADARVLSPDGKYFASKIYNKDESAHWVVGDLKNGKVQTEFPEDVFRILAFSPNSEMVAVLEKGEEESMVSIWKLIRNSSKPGSGSKLCQFSISHYGDPELCRFSPDGQSLAIVTKLNTVSIRDTQSGNLIAKNLIKGKITSLAYDPNTSANRLAIGVSENVGSIVLWDIEKNRNIKTFIDRDADSVSALAFSPDSKIIYSGDGLGNIKQWIPSR